jgi:hypothetical protein
MGQKQGKSSKLDKEELFNAATDDSNLPQLKKLFKSYGDALTELHTEGEMKCLLHIACEKRCNEIILFLLYKPIDVNVCDKRMWTALHYSGRLGVVNKQLNTQFTILLTKHKSHLHSD